MARSSVANGGRQLIDQAILDDLAADLVAESHPGIEDRPKLFSAFTTATAALIQPPLEALVLAYRQACTTTAGREAANRFLHNLLAAEA